QGFRHCCSTFRYPMYGMIPCYARYHPSYFYRPILLFVTNPLRLSRVETAMSFGRRLSSLIARKLVLKPVLIGRSVASITFDDFPKSAWDQGGAVMARHGVRGTYYTAGGFCGRT